METKDLAEEFLAPLVRVTGENIYADATRDSLHRVANAYSK